MSTLAKSEQKSHSQKQISPLEVDLDYSLSFVVFYLTSESSLIDHS